MLPQGNNDLGAVSSGLSHCAVIEEVRLIHCKLFPSDDEVVTFVNSLCSKTCLNHLTVNIPEVTDKACVHLCAKPKHQECFNSLAGLVLRGSGFGNSAATLLAGDLKRNMAEIEMLQLDSELERTAILSLIDSLSTNIFLSELDLGNACINKHSFFCLLDSLQTSVFLKTLCIGMTDHDMTQEDISEASKLMK